MKLFKIISILTTLVISMAVLASGCNNSKSDEGPAVVATVNGKEIKRDDFNARLQQIAGQQILDQMITEELILQEAVAMKVDISDEDINKEFDETKKRFGGDAQFNDFLAKRGETAEDAKERIKLQLIMQELVGKTVKITDKEIKTQYDQYKDTLYVGKKLEEVKSEITEQLQQQMMAQKIPAYIEGLKAKAKIVNNIAPTTTTTSVKAPTEKKSGATDNDPKAMEDLKGESGSTSSTEAPKDDEGEEKHEE